MKRRLISDEQLARQDERAQVGRDIHDSVGHKLTALLKQLEVFRMQTEDTEVDSRLQVLKELAKESLEDTRNAVKVMKQNETGGLSAILRLIRKLEAESFIRVHFSVKRGALSAPLNNEQSIAVYRAVQEALTNIMRHSKAREAEITFEAPGGGIFLFEVINPIIAEKSFREGFGLQSMRERIEHAGGRLEIIQYDDRFVVHGTLSMLDKRGAEV
jgi:signal transduction histidine kinase